MGKEKSTTKLKVLNDDNQEAIKLGGGGHGRDLKEVRREELEGEGRRECVVILSQLKVIKNKILV